MRRLWSDRPSSLFLPEVGWMRLLYCVSYLVSEEENSHRKFGRVSHPSGFLSCTVIRNPTFTQKVPAYIGLGLLIEIFLDEQSSHCHSKIVIGVTDASSPSCSVWICSIQHLQHKRKHDYLRAWPISVQLLTFWLRFSKRIWNALWPTPILFQWAENANIVHSYNFQKQWKAIELHAQCLHSNSLYKIYWSFETCNVGIGPQFQLYQG